MSFLIIPVVLLVGLLAIGLPAWAQRRRRLGLAQSAHKVGLRFSAPDIFQVSRRYACFVLAQAGHSPLAENVLYGRFDQWQVRCFDYRFEAGHGPRRIVRRYSVMVADTDIVTPRTILWDQNDTGLMPLAAQHAQSHLSHWWIVDGPEYAAKLLSACEELASQPVHLQAEGGTIIACFPRRWLARQVPDRLAEFSRALAKLQG